MIPNLTPMMINPTFDANFIDYPLDQLHSKLGSIKDTYRFFSQYFYLPQVSSKAITKPFFEALLTKSDMFLVSKDITKFTYKNTQKGIEVLLDYLESHILSKYNLKTYMGYGNLPDFEWVADVILNIEGHDKTFRLLSENSSSVWDIFYDPLEEKIPIHSWIAEELTDVPSVYDARSKLFSHLPIKKQLEAFSKGQMHHPPQSYQSQKKKKITRGKRGPYHTKKKLAEASVARLKARALLEGKLMDGGDEDDQRGGAKGLRATGGNRNSGREEIKKMVEGELMDTAKFRSGFIRVR